MPTRRKTEQYWESVHFEKLKTAPPGKLYSKGPASLAASGLSARNLARRGAPAGRRPQAADGCPADRGGAKSIDADARSHFGRADTSDSIRLRPNQRPRTRPDAAKHRQSQMRPRSEQKIVGVVRLDFVQAVAAQPSRRGQSERGKGTMVPRDKSTERSRTPRKRSARSISRVLPIRRRNWRDCWCFAA